MSEYEQIRLPIGIRSDGSTIFRDVHIDEMSGIDEEIIANPKFKSSPIRAETALLARCVQEIPGLLERRADPYTSAPIEIFRSMFEVDREFLVTAIRRISMGDEVTTDWRCAACGTDNSDQTKLSELRVVEWEDGKPTVFPFEITKGVQVGGTTHTRGKLKLLTGIDAETVAAAAARAPESAGTAFLVALIASWEDGSKPTFESIRRMRSSDRARLADIVRDQMPGTQMKRDIACANCGRVTEGVEVGAAGFFGTTSRR